MRTETNDPLAIRSTAVSTDASLLDLPSAASTYREVNGVELHLVTAGDPGDPPVVLLHGFPDFWYGWRHQIPALVGAGFRVLAPDGRGYNLSEKPSELDAYRLSVLSADVAELIETEGHERAHVVGHDWGGGVAWDLALRHPEVVDRLAVLNAPHPAVFRKALRSNLRQIVRSWYMAFFQLPRVPEFVLGRNDAAGVLELLEASANPGAFSEADLDRYREAWRREGAIPGSLHWYRAAVRRPEGLPRTRVESPTLVIWGEADRALLCELAEESLGYCPEGRLERFPDASHWVHLEEPAGVNDLLCDHLA